MSEDKEFICSVRSEPCECDKKGCTAKKDPQLLAFESIAKSLEEIAFQLRLGNDK